MLHFYLSAFLLCESECAHVFPISCNFKQNDFETSFVTNKDKSVSYVQQLENRKTR